MHSSGSMILSVIERGRALLDDPDVDAKYNDDWWVRHALAPSMVTVWSRLNLMLENPVYCKHLIELEEGVSDYVLPPCIGQVLRVARMNDDGDITYDWRPDGQFHSLGPGWFIEGNIFSVRPYPQRTATADETFHLWYIHNGDMGLHYATSGTMSAETLSLSATLERGWRDKRLNAYAGQMLRILGSGVWQEKVIESSSPSANSGNGTVTVRMPFAGTADEPQPSSSVTYEIVPTGASQPLWDAIACASALRMGTIRKIPQTHYAMIQQEYRMALKTAADFAANLNQRTGKKFDKNTVDHNERGWGVWGSMYSPEG